MLGIELYRKSEVSLSRQIFSTLREQMINGNVKSGEALPSTRELAKELAVSRNTVCEAYDMLLAEGYVISRQGAPTRVADGLSMGKINGFEHHEEKSGLYHEIKADFMTGQPDLRKFPVVAWNKVLHKAINEMPYDLLGYKGPDGLIQLREEISAWLFRSRGIKADSGDIFITAGATHALHLLADLLCSGRNRDILIEDPCHIGMLNTLKNRRCSVYPIPVDALGIQTEFLATKEAAAIYVTPSHQYPLGGILSAKRRVELIRYAREKAAFIIEDDYDSEFRYCGEPVSPLYSMDSDNVIYVGTFSKILFPALRIGYVILPSRLHKQWRYLRTHSDVQNPPFEQVALAEYMNMRKLDRHIRHMRNLYGERRRIFLDSMREVFGESWEVWGDAAGLHMVLQFKGMVFDGEFAEKSRESGIRITPVEYHSIKKGVHVDKLLVGYGHMEREEIQKSIIILYNFFSDYVGRKAL